jgi:hypothetical protein
VSNLCKATSFAIVLMPMTTSVSGAVTYPYKLHQKQNIDTHQVGWVDLMIDAQGHDSLTDSWSNGKRTSGNTFYAIVVLVGKDGKAIHSDKQMKGLDGSWGGRSDLEGTKSARSRSISGAGQRDIEALGRQKLAELNRQDFMIPTGLFGEFVVGDYIGALLRRGEMAEPKDR